MPSHRIAITAELSSEGVQREVVEVEVRWIDTQIKRSALLSKVRESSKRRPRARRERKREGKREKKGGDANASRPGGAVKRSKSRSKFGRDGKAGGRTATRAVAG
jgi:hypothetical protein